MSLAIVVTLLATPFLSSCAPPLRKHHELVKANNLRHGDVINGFDPAFFRQSPIRSTINQPKHLVEITSVKHKSKEPLAIILTSINDSKRQVTKANKKKIGKAPKNQYVILGDHAMDNRKPVHQNKKDNNRTTQEQLDKIEKFMKALYRKRKTYGTGNNSVTEKSVLNLDTEPHHNVRHVDPETNIFPAIWNTNSAHPSPIKSKASPKNKKKHHNADLNENSFSDSKEDSNQELKEDSLVFPKQHLKKDFISNKNDDSNEYSIRDTNENFDQNLKNDLISDTKEDNSQFHNEVSQNFNTDSIFSEEDSNPNSNPNSNSDFILDTNEDLNDDLDSDSFWKFHQDPNSDLKMDYLDSRIELAPNSNSEDANGDFDLSLSLDSHENSEKKKVSNQSLNVDLNLHSSSDSKENSNVEPKDNLKKESNEEINETNVVTDSSLSDEGSMVVTDKGENKNQATKETLEAMSEEYYFIDNHKMIKMPQHLKKHSTTNDYKENIPNKSKSQDVTNLGQEASVYNKEVKNIANFNDSPENKGQTIVYVDSEEYDAIFDKMHKKYVKLEKNKKIVKENQNRDDVSPSYLLGNIKDNGKFELKNEPEKIARNAQAEDTDFGITPEDNNDASQGFHQEDEGERNKNENKVKIADIANLFVSEENNSRSEETGLAFKKEDGSKLTVTSERNDDFDRYFPKVIESQGTESKLNYSYTIEHLIDLLGNDSNETNLNDTETFKNGTIENKGILVYLSGKEREDLIKSLKGGFGKNKYVTHYLAFTFNSK